MINFLTLTLYDKYRNISSVLGVHLLRFTLIPEPDNAGVGKQIFISPPSDLGGFFMKNSKTKYLTISSLLIALSILTNQIKILHMPLGGSITLFSMLFATLIGYYLGPKWGISSCCAIGILNILIGGYIYHPVQVLLDYILGFSSLGLSGYFSKKRNGLLIGYLISILFRFIFSTISGYVFFSSYAPSSMNPFIYSVIYQLEYIGVEGLLTIILISLPVVKNAICKLNNI